MNACCFLVSTPPSLFTIHALHFQLNVGQKLRMGFETGVSA